MNGALERGVLVRCRCGRKHQPREQATACSYCLTPTWDHHAVCARCRGVEALERHAAEVAALVDASSLGDDTDKGGDDASTHSGKGPVVVVATLSRSLREASTG